MEYPKSNRGFTLIELLLVIGIIFILVSMSALITDKYFKRRAIDKITYDLTSTLNLAKLQAARHGVEYQTECSYNSTDKEITLVTKKGNSNRMDDADFTDPGKYVETGPPLVIKMDTDYTIVESANPLIFRFKPTGTTNALDLGANIVLTLAPTSTSDVIKCGIVTVEELGRISTVIGNWDGTICRPIRDTQS